MADHAIKRGATTADFGKFAKTFLLLSTGITYKLIIEFKLIENYMSENHLQLWRKKTALTQGDVASLLGFYETTHLSKVEKGVRPINIDIMLGYHLLFDIPLDQFLLKEKQRMLEKIINKSEPLLCKLEFSEPSLRKVERMEVIKTITTRLQNK